jgi:hypothetical protein
LTGCPNLRVHLTGGPRCNRGGYLRRAPHPRGGLQAVHRTGRGLPLGCPGGAPPGHRVPGPQFLYTLLQRTPFPVRALQVDGGSEFYAEFEAACLHKGLPLFVLPLKSPKLNAHVERANRTHIEEFYEVAPDLPWNLTQLAPAYWSMNGSTTPSGPINPWATSRPWPSGSGGRPNTLQT